MVVSCGIQKYANVIYDAGSKGTHSQLAFFNLPVGFVCLVKTTMVDGHKQAVAKLNRVKKVSSSRLAQ